MATRCIWPPESWLERWVQCDSSRPALRSTMAACSSLSLSARRPRTPRGSTTLRMHGRSRQQVERLEHEADAGPPDVRQIIVGEGGDVLAFEEVLTAGGRIQCPQDVHEGGLARAGWSHDGHELTRVDGKAYAPQCMRLVLSREVDLCQLAAVDHMGAGCCLSWCVGVTHAGPVSLAGRSEAAATGHAPARNTAPVQEGRPGRAGRWWSQWSSRTWWSETTISCPSVRPLVSRTYESVVIPVSTVTLLSVPSSPRVCT